jgi:hypothetical protein
MNRGNEEIKKKVDETWKEAVAKEKLKSDKESTAAPPKEVDFISFISTLSMQALSGLGILPNPLTNKKEEDLNLSRYIIDTINMLREKTQGNLTPEEAEFIDNILYELRTKFIERVK